MYHIISDLETIYTSLDTVVIPQVLVPYIPTTTMPGENTTIKRVCAAPTIEQCMTAIGLIGRFRRCLAENEDAFSYDSEGNEVYPIIVVKLPDDFPWYTPTTEEVPDQATTGEKWALTPIQPIHAEIKWLSPWSIIMDERLICTSVTFEDDISGKDHPWLNGKGHPLESSEDEDDTWCGNIPFPMADSTEFKYMETRILRRPVLAFPIDNAYSLCYPIDEPKQGEPFTWPVRAARVNLRRMTGCLDSKGQELYERSNIRYCGYRGYVDWCRGAYGVRFLTPKQEAGFIPFYSMEQEDNGWLIRVTLID